MSYHPSCTVALINALSFTAPRARPQRNKNTGLQDILAAERLDEWGDVEKKHRQPKRRLKRNTNVTKRVKVMDNLSDHDPDDDEYETELVDSSSSEATHVSIASEGNISNEEVSAALLSTILPFCHSQAGFSWRMSFPRRWCPLE